MNYYCRWQILQDQSAHKSLLLQLVLIERIKALIWICNSINPKNRLILVISKLLK